MDAPPSYGNRGFSVGAPPDQEMHRQDSDEKPGVYNVPMYDMRGNAMQEGAIPVYTDQFNDDWPEPKRSPIAITIHIITRFVSAAFIVGDCVCDWLTQNDIETEEYGTISGGLSVDCNTETERIETLYYIFLILGTVYAAMQVINIVGETLLQVVGDMEKKCTVGFQIMHGWVETFGSYVFVDVPQAVLILFFSGSCKAHIVVGLRQFFTMWIALFKNTTRKSTCKQKYKPFCVDCGKIRCCTLPLLCCDFVVCGHPPNTCDREYRRATGRMYSRNRSECCALIPSIWGYEIPFQCCSAYYVCCRQLGCFLSGYTESACCKFERENQPCCSIGRDPKWAEKILEYINTLYFVIVILTILNRVLLEKNMLS